MMDDGNEKNEPKEGYNREEIFSRAVRAGRRTYFFDVKSTRKNEYYLTITESKKRYNKEGEAYFEKHKVFLYKEDFEKFSRGFEEAIDFINNNNGEPVSSEEEKITDQPVDDTAPVATTEETVEKEVETPVADEFTNVEFEDLEDKSE